MRVTILAANPNIASTRYRAVYPARFLREHGVTLCGDDGDLLIVGKHFFTPEICAPFKAVIFDVCDDHFGDKEHGEHYKKMCADATAITCNSDFMRFRIHKETGRVATVIEDPYEREEWEPSWGEGMLWYGHPSNLRDLFRVMPSIKDCGTPLGVISLREDWMKPEMASAIVPWSPTAMDKGLQSCRFVIIPTGLSAAKSANRLIEAVRAGKFVIAEPLPAYEEFARWMWVGDIREGVEWANKNEKECLRRVRECQKYVKKHYSQEKIGQKWLDLIKKVYPWGAVLGGR